MKIISRKEAKAKGLKHYFTGKPCKHGHVERRRIDGTCLGCGRENMRREYQERRRNVSKDEGIEQQWLFLLYGEKLVSRKEAKNRGQRRWFTGIPCKYGHIADRTDQGCVVCHAVDQERRLRARGVKPRKRVSATEKTERGKQWYWKNRERELSRAKERRAEMTEEQRTRVNELALQRYYKNRGHILAQAKVYRERNRPRILERERSEKYRARKRDNKRRARESLCDYYVRERLTEDSPLSARDIPPEWVEFYRSLLRAHRKTSSRGKSR